MSPKTHHIVILGAGFAGLRVALELCKRRARLRACEITLIDRHGFQAYAPLLYEVATGVIDCDESQELIEAVSVSVVDHPRLQHKKCVNFQKGEVTSIDSGASVVNLKGGKKVFYDDLVIAVGACGSTRGVPGVAEHAHMLKTIHEAMQIRTEIMKAKGRVKVAVVGAGATGTEFAAELASALGKKVKIDLIEGGENVLGYASPAVQKVAYQRLLELGVKIRTKTFVSSVTKEGVNLSQDDQDEFLATDLVLWTAGVEPCAVMKKMEFKKDKKGFLSVDPTFLVKDQINIFSLGDCASFLHPETKQPVPMLGQSAIKQAPMVAENIVRRLERKNLLTWKPPAHWITVVPLGGRQAVADFGWFNIAGRLGHLIRLMAHLMYFFTVFPPRQALKRWWKAVKIFSRNDQG